MSAQNSNAMIVPGGAGLVLSTNVRSLQDTLMTAARASIELAVAEQGHAMEEFGDLNIRAMVVTEALRMTSGLDLATVLARGAFIKQIEEEGLVGVHPNGYANLTHLAKENGIASVAELSDIRSLCEVIFPYVENVLGWDLADTWEKVGKSNFRELVPALRSMITGENADHDSVRSSVEQMLNNSAADILANEHTTVEELDDSEVRRNAVESLLRGTVGRTVRETRRAVRPSPVPAVPMATLRLDEQWFAVLNIHTQEQFDLVQRILSAHANNMTLDASELTPAQRRFLHGVFGETE